MAEHSLFGLQRSTLGGLIDTGADYLQQADLVYGHGTDNPHDEAAWLALEACGYSPLEPLLDDTVMVNRGHLERAKDWFRRRAIHREPVAYITGRAWFAGLEFDTDSRALIPRSPIAELIHDNYQPWLTDTPSAILDLCCGGGCIAVASALAFPQSLVHACDLSPDALELAATNVEKHELTQRVKLFEGDLFDAAPSTQKYDLIVSNPPYVDKQDMGDLPAEYQHEPKMGLTAGDDGLDIVRRIVEGARDRLSDKGVLVVEVGNSQPAVELNYPALEMVWLEFEMGGGGVFVTSAHALQETR